MIKSSSLWLGAAIAATVIVSTAPPALAFTDYYGRYFYSDGSQERNSRVIAGAAPNMEATFDRGIRCEYRYIVRPQGKQRIQVCE